MIKAAILAFGLLPLSACGFTPVYGNRAEVADAGPIHIAEISGRTGHFLRQELLRTVGGGLPGVKGEAQLEVTLKDRIERLTFAPDQAASRSDFVGTADWALRSVDGTVLASGGTVERASFNFADAPYGDLAAQTAAQERLATLLARSIRLQMTVNIGEPRKAATKPATVPITTTPATPGAATPPSPLVPGQ